MQIKRLIPRRLRPPAQAVYWSLHPKLLARKGWTLWAYGAFRRRPVASLRYLLFDREYDNFTYDISNHDELARFLADALRVPVEQAFGYILELERDAQLRSTLEHRLRSRPDRNRHARYGRRLGWYAAARIRKPRLIVETGVHDGLGSAVLLRALSRNAADGHPGRLLSFDIREDVGWLIDEGLRELLELVIGDTRSLLPPVLEGREVEMFIHDSDHSHEHETFEFETIAKFARPGAILISDNAHAGTAFAEFCNRRRLRQYFFRERPQRHFYPGAGIGLTIYSGQDESTMVGLSADPGAHAERTAS
jgi:predicted O-methyltransferase YrrM